ncbi:MAG: chemotaxis protein [Gammaproteobacteria bacterium]|nr:MAG: chemotaxis protein [Gammaproteobacteria bacterium]
MEILIRYFIAMFFMLAILFIWLMVQKLSRKFAADHPEFGPAREEGGGCGGGGKCNCGSIKNCTNPKIKHKASKKDF